MIIVLSLLVALIPKKIKNNTKKLFNNLLIVLSL